MLRRTLRLTLIFLLLSGFFVPAAKAGAAGRVVILTVDGTDIHDWISAGAFASFGGAGLLATRTETTSTDPITLRLSAYASLGAGAAAGVDARGRPKKDGAVPGLLGETLARAGKLAAAVGDGSGDDRRDAPASLAVARLDGSVATGPNERLPAVRAAVSVSRADATAPAGRRTDPAAIRDAIRSRLAWASVVIVDTGDTARADRAFGADPAARGPWVRRALTDADRLAGDVLSMLDGGDVLMVASLVPPITEERRGVHLGAVAIAGAPSLLRSETTRRAGVVSLTDLAPTIATDLGLDPPAEMTGRPVELEPSSDPRSIVERTDAELTRALRSRRPLTRVWLVSAAALCVAALLTIAAGRGRAAGATRIPRGWRDALGIGFLSVAAAPGAFLVAPLLPDDTVAAVGWWTLGIAVAVAAAGRIALGYRRALALIAFAGAALYAGDLLAGSPLAARSAIGFQIAGGGRFYGVDEGMLGVLLGAPLAAAGIAIDRTRTRGALVAAGAGLAAIAFVAAAPSLGSKFGAPFTLVPAFGVFVVLASGRRLDRRSVVGIAIATVLLSASLAAADALLSPDTASHIGRAVSGHTAVGPLVTRKLTSLVTITATTVWFPATVVIGGSALVLVLRRRDLVGRAMWGSPGTRAALWAAVVGSACSLVSNDTGIITVAAAAPIVAAGFYGPFLAADDPR